MKKENAALLFLVVTHVAGLIGLNIEAVRSFFLFFTPFNLILSFAIVLYFHEDWKRSVVSLLMVWGILGFFIEVLGVKTGFPFGTYEYGHGLGVKLFEVSLVMTVNWATMLYCSHVVARQWVTNKAWRILIASAIMTGIDVVIEPVSGSLEMWHWAGGEAPAINFLGWFVFSILMHILGINFNLKNKIAAGYLVIMFVFFSINNFL